MRLHALLVSSLLLAACGPLVYKIDVQQGNHVTQDLAAKLKKGMTKVEVKQLLGTPLLTDAFHANRWDYFFSSVKRGRAEDRTRLSVFFQDEKVVEFTGNARPNTPAPVGSSTAPAVR